MAEQALFFDRDAKSIWMDRAGAYLNGLQLKVLFNSQH
jgi:hypothetical protein